jgi:DNA ligase (NAD+)
MDFKKNPKTNFKDLDKLSEAEAQGEIEALRVGIDYHDYLYYVKNEPEISDAVYDRLFERLQKLEEEFPKYQSKTSPTRRVGAEPVDELERVAHAAPMLSLNSVCATAAPDGPWPGSFPPKKKLRFWRTLSFRWAEPGC